MLKFFEKLKYNTLSKYKVDGRLFFATNAAVGIKSDDRYRKGIEINGAIHELTPPFGIITEKSTKFNNL